MGSIARMSRSSRFIKEFSDDLLKEDRVNVGKTFKLIDITLEFCEGEDVVRPNYLFREVSDSGAENRKNQFCTLGEEVVFDAENDMGDDLAERVSNALGIEEEKARERLKTAWLL